MGSVLSEGSILNLDNIPAHYLNDGAPTVLYDLGNQAQVFGSGEGSHSAGSPVALFDTSIPTGQYSIIEGNIDCETSSTPYYLCKQQANFIGEYIFTYSTSSPMVSTTLQIAQRADYIVVILLVICFVGILDFLRRVLMPRSW